MSQEPGRFRSPRIALQAVRTRLVMAGAFVGALIALGLNVAFSWTDDAAGGSGTGPGGGKLSPAAEEAFKSPAGSCLNWKQKDAADVHIVPCGEPHLFEVTSVEDIGGQYPKGAPTPDIPTWERIAQEHCTGNAKNYLGKPLDPYGKFTVNILRPTAAQWTAGDRQLRCGLQWTGPGGSLQKLTGSAKDQQQSLVWEPGTCLALTGKTFGDPTDCAREHSYEIIAKLDLKTKFPDSYPSQDDQKTWLDTECTKAAADYTGGADLGEKKLILTWDTRETESWDAGSTLVNCKVAAKLEDGSGLAAVTGSVKGGPQGDAPPDASSASPTPTSGG
ncbi:septum formation family protein [Amycolatopsis xylanica]|nr:septum formation family protein [Amycolatopsis xylanica]